MPGRVGSISKKEVDLLCTKKIESVIFDLTDSMGGMKKESSVQILRNLLYEKVAIQMILIVLYNHIKKLYFTKLAREQNLDVAKVLNLKPNQMFLVNKYTRQASKFSLEELSNILQELRDLDYNYKLRKN